MDIEIDAEMETETETETDIDIVMVMDLDMDDAIPPITDQSPPSPPTLTPTQKEEIKREKNGK